MISLFYFFMYLFYDMENMEKNDYYQKRDERSAAYTKIGIYIFLIETVVAVTLWVMGYPECIH